ncbi:MAG: polymerase subunit gamma/tau [Micrococcaceae bacterium]|nr:polymerase subunit gamma/tau [Micrococcaceae bacterium]
MSTALYRRYRPETFVDVIGQEHVTGPLMAAIDKDRINHAYLFSGPRGCGKTTSARILARCLNCAQGPTSTPCGTCDSCVELARNGSGSLDVIEIDAASHGGVDDARDLRERATFAPVRDRFKIFIIDEAHMVTSAGFNALLKIVEEPPEHILFIFATTEPDKVIGTIRSRTHHYPFRLVPPEPLMGYLELLCRQENVPVAPGVLSLVIRAGGGSVRDSLSVLDQLMAGAGEAGLDYELAVSLLGYTHATLLDDVVDSIAAGDAGTVFDAVDRVIQTGHDPRRFVEDLLERFRDLIVINAVPEGAASILRGVPDDQLNRMRTQATQLGAGELSRDADVTNTALTEMTGATSPRLHLELLCARLLLPAADATARGTLARVDRIERRLEYAGGAPTPQVDAEADAAPKPPARARLDVPRTAEEAAARWSLPAADPAAPAVPAAIPGAQSPALPAAGADRPGAAPATADSSPDWGAAWGVSAGSAFENAKPRETPDKPPAATGSAPAPGRTPASSGPAESSERSGPAGSSGPATPGPVTPGPVTSGPATPRQDVPTAQPQDGRAADGAHDDGHDAGPGSVPSRSADAPAAQEPGASTGGRTEAPQDQQAAAADGRAEAPGRPGTAPQRAASPPSRETYERPPGAPEQGSVQNGQGQESRPPEPGHQGQPASPGGGNIEMVRRAWPEIMDEVAKIKRATWLIVNVSAKPRSFEGNQLVLAFANQGTAIGFQRGPHMDNVKQAIHKVLGLTCSIEAVHDAGGAGESGPKVPSSGPGRNPGPASSAPAHDIGAPVTPRISAGQDAQPSPGSGAGGQQRPDHAAPAGGSATSGSTLPASEADGRPVEADSAQPVPVPVPVPAPEPSSGPTGPHLPPMHVPSEVPVGQDDTRPATGTSTADSAGTPTPAARVGDTPAFAAPGHVPATDRTDRIARTEGTPVADSAVQASTLSAADKSTVGSGDTHRESASLPGSLAADAVQASTLSAADKSTVGSGDTQGQSAAQPASVAARRSAPRTSGDATVQGLRGPGRQGAPVDPGAEAVSAWDPTMSDESWALVEPPEEAFDPGPGWGSVPEDPNERRPAQPPRTQARQLSGQAAPNARAASPSPSRTDQATRSGSHPAAAPGRSAAGSHPAAAPGRSAAGGPAQEEPASRRNPAAEPASGPAGPGVRQAPESPSRSVVWSPPAAAPPAKGDGQAGANLGQAAPAQGKKAAIDGEGHDPSAASSSQRPSPATGRPVGAVGSASSSVASALVRPVSAENVLQKPVSRYQQLLDEAERKRAEEAAAALGAVDLRFVEDEPSADDETIEESGLVGRTAIERILNGRLVEERGVDGQ